MAKKCEECVKEEVIDIAMKRIDGLEKKMNGHNGDPGYTSNIADIKSQITSMSNRSKNTSGWVKALIVVGLGLLGVGINDHFKSERNEEALTEAISNISELYVRKDYFIQYFYTLENKNIILEHMLLTTKYKDFLEYKIKLDSVNGILKQHEATRGPKKEKEDWLETDSIQ